VRQGLLGPPGYALAGDAGTYLNKIVLAKLVRIGQIMFGFEQLWLNLGKIWAN